MYMFALYMYAGYYTFIINQNKCSMEAIIDKELRKVTKGLLPLNEYIIYKMQILATFTNTILQKSCIYPL